MSSPEQKSITRKKRSSTEANPSNPPEGDHRKRRRNRTTQSCLNCHTSKRMCDRKRPCGRCTQLGLTGLCVYEVDDPSQRPEVQDESSRLRKRVAELEGVIRELKNKPHPRWVQAGSTPEVEFEKWHARSQSRSAADQPPTEHGSEPNSISSSEDPPSSSSSSSPVCRDRSHPQAASPPTRPTTASTQPSELVITPPYSPYFSEASSPISTPSPAIMTPTDEYTRTQALIVGDHPLTGEFDFASMFMSYPGLMECGDGLGQSLGQNTLGSDAITDHLNDACMSKHHCHTSPESHCGCLTEGSSYNVVLELSLRLRKSADILSRSAYHSLGSNCALHRRVVELDSLATTTLGNITTSPNDISQIPPQPRPLSHKYIPSLSTFTSGSCRSSTVSPQTLQGIRNWDVMSSVSESSSTCEDSFMSWEPSRRA